MTTIVLKTFGGEIPNSPPHLLPDAAAQQALKCDFAQKDLRPLRAGLLYKSFSSASKSLYTADGLTFFTWSTEVQAVRSPTINDAYGRVYFTDGTGLRVTSSAPTASGGMPAVSYKVGVPASTTAPFLSTVERTTLRGYSSTSVSARAWYEAGGARYDESAVSLTAVSGLRKYTFAAPARSSGTPGEATLRASFTLTDSSTSKDIFSVTMDAGGTATTAALPGGVELALSQSGTTCTIGLTWGTYETRAYTYTVSNIWSEESAPAPAAVIDVNYMQDVRVGAVVPVFTGYCTYSKTNIYRTFGTSSSYVRVNVTQESATQFLDASYQVSDIGAALPSADWQEPPSGLYGLVSLPGGVLAAFKDNLVYFCEPYRPHTWQHSRNFPHNVRGICAAPQSLVVTTAAGAYIVVGATPSTMQSIMLPTPQAGMAHRAMTLAEGVVVYASNDGLVTVAGSQADINASQQYFSREDWRSRYGAVLADMALAYHDGFIVAASSTEAKGLLIRLDEAVGTCTQWNEQVDALTYVPSLDKLYYLKNNQLYGFRNGSYETLDWWSKDFELASPVNFAAFYIRCTGPVTVTLYADKAQWHQFTANATGYYTLPAGKRSTLWSVRLQTSATVQVVALAQSKQELRNV